MKGSVLGLPALNSGLLRRAMLLSLSPTRCDMKPLTLHHCISTVRRVLVFFGMHGGFWTCIATASRILAFSAILWLILDPFFPEVRV